VVESQLVVGGIPVQVLDTAGIRDATDKVEQLGVERSRSVAQSADLVLLTIDAQTGWTDADQAIYDQVNHRPLILVANKVDLLDVPMVSYPPEIEPVVYTAAAQNKGIETLEQAILEAVHQGTLTAANLDLAINQRQAAALTQTQTALELVQQAIADQLPLDFWTIDLRTAIHALGEITGEEATESVLDLIFSRFCIGK
jgi:tRNA modification GTPase